MGVKLDDAGAIAGIASLVVAVLALLGDQASLSASARQRFRRSTGLLALGLGVGSVVWGAAVLTEKEVPSRWQDIVVWPAVSVGVGVVMLIFGGIRFLRTGVSTEVETLRTLATSVNRRMVELDKRTRFDPARYV
jgi:hypothetical protein